MVIGIKPEMIGEYRALHADAWPEILDRITRSGIRNYSIYLKTPENLLFSYYEYIGNDYEADMNAIAEDEATKRWWALTDPCQQKLSTAGPSDWWSEMEEVFHHD
jgi:L-rhamnose mutarotase